VLGLRLVGSFMGPSGRLMFYIVDRNATGRWRRLPCFVRSIERWGAGRGAGMSSARRVKLR
jgi:hypothetical protein